MITGDGAWIQSSPADLAVRIKVGGKENKYVIVRFDPGLGASFRFLSFFLYELEMGNENIFFENDREKAIELLESDECVAKEFVVFDFTKEGERKGELVFVGDYEKTLRRYSSWAMGGLIKRPPLYKRQSPPRNQRNSSLAKLHH